MQKNQPTLPKKEDAWKEEVKAYIALPANADRAPVQMEILNHPRAKVAYNRILKASGKPEPAFFSILLAMCASLKGDMRHHPLYGLSQKELLNIAISARRLYQLVKDISAQPLPKELLERNGGYQGTAERWVRETTREKWFMPLPQEKLTDEIILNALHVISVYFDPFSQPLKARKGRKKIGAGRSILPIALNSILRSKYGNRRPMHETVAALMEATWGQRWDSNRVKVELYRIRKGLGLEKG